MNYKTKKYLGMVLPPLLLLYAIISFFQVYGEDMALVEQMNVRAGYTREPTCPLCQPSKLLACSSSNTADGKKENDDCTGKVGDSVRSCDGDKGLVKVDNKTFDQWAEVKNGDRADCAVLGYMECVLAVNGQAIWLNITNETACGDKPTCEEIPPLKYDKDLSLGGHPCERRNFDGEGE